MIGLVEKFKGIYHLTLNDKHENAYSINNSFVCTLPNNSLWNFLLVHMFHSRIQSLHSIFPFVIVDHKVICDVCHYIKNKKLPYTFRFNKSKHPFDLVHFHVWGPLAINSYQGRSYF